MIPAMRRSFRWARSSDLVRSNGVVALTVVLVGFVVLQLWNWSPGIPLSLGGDNSFYLMHAENLARGGQFYTNNNLGAPLGQFMHDYPAVGEFLNYEYLRILAIITKSAPVAETLFYFSSFVFVAIASNIASRRLGIDRMYSIAVAVLFAYLPYHLIKNVQHLMLSNYVAIPIIVWVLVSILRPMDIHSTRHRFLALFFAGFITGGTGIYYSVFSLLIVTGICLLAGFKEVDRRGSLCRFAAYLSGLALSIALSVMPLLRFALKNGFHDFRRNFVEVEYYGLKIANLFRPIVEHRFEPLARFSRRFSSSLIPGEPVEMLGLIGSVGLILIFLRLLSVREAFAGDQSSSWIEKVLARTSLLAIVVASVGAFNSILFVLGLHQIRVWSRISPLIAFCALNFLALRTQHHLPARISTPRVARAVVVMAVVVGLLDQTSASFVPDYKNNQQRWASEQKFTNAADAHFEPGARVLQLPLVSFPEHGPEVRMPDYYQVFPFIHGSQLHWSYGHLKTRSSSFHDKAVQLDQQELLIFARRWGFVGVHVARTGFGDNGEAVVSEITKLGGRLVYQDSENVNLLFDISSIN